MSTPLFEQGVAAAVGSIAIVLVDCSGSTDAQITIGEYKGRKIFDKMTDIAQQIPENRFRVIFWSSSDHNKGQFRSGVMKMKGVLEGKPALKTAFTMAKMNIGGGTRPSLGFRAIENDWFKDDPMVYFFTDGDVDRDDKSVLALTIAALPKIRLSIVAVENRQRDFDNVAEAQSAAGGEVYRVIQDNKLSKQVMSFVSHCLNGKFGQISRIEAPKGFACYGENYFEVTRVPEFIEYVRALLAQNPDEQYQLEVAQKLSITLEYLTRDKPKRVQEDIVNMFCGLFTLDKTIVNYILTDAIDKERGGQAAVFANYRANLKNLFRQADEMLKSDVCNAVGLRDQFVSVPISDRVLTGSYRLIDAPVYINGQKYPRAGFTIQLPVFPLLKPTDVQSESQEQCLRQWVRAVFATLFYSHTTSDEIVYLMMGICLNIQRSPGVSAQVKYGYRRLVRVMLNKKRANSMTTEYELIKSGEFPTPNSGKIDEFYGMMRSVASKLKIEASPLKLWYELCMAFDPEIADVQRRHCVAELDSAITFTSESVSQDIVPTDSAYDYSCVITGDNVSNVGGFRIIPHNICAPMYIFSERGKTGLLNCGRCVCPICYAPLRGDSFESVGPKPKFELLESYGVCAARFSNDNRPASRGNNNNAPVPFASAVAPGARIATAITNANGKTGVLVIMKGTVGAGKSTYSQALKAGVEARGGSCYVEGTDKYCQVGLDTRSAIGRVHQELNKVSADQNDDIVVVIDTCGENTEKNNYKVFDVDFTGWKKLEVSPNLERKDMKGYFAWSLRNVLQRGKPGPNTNHYLNPVDASPKVCIDVHKKKCQRLFGGQMKLWTFAGTSLNDAELNNFADAYAVNHVRPFVMPF